MRRPRVPHLCTWRRRLRQYAGCGTSRREEGRAVIEFIFIGLLLLVPLVYLVMAVGRVQAAAFATTSAAREAGRAYTTAPDAASAPARAQAAAALSFDDFGFGDEGTVSLRCDGSPCLRPDGKVEVVAQVSVRLPLVPDALAGVIPPVMPVTATHVATVDRFAGRRS